MPADETLSHAPDAERPIDESLAAMHEAGGDHIRDGIHNADHAFECESEYAPDQDGGAEPDVVGEGWSGADIEQAYLKALNALESAELPVDEMLEPAEATEAVAPAAAPEPGTLPFAPAETDPQAAIAGQTGSESPAGDQRDAAAGSAGKAGALVPPEKSPPGKSPSAELALLDERQQISPAQVIEAALFVGGAPLTAKRLCAVLRGDFEPSYVDQTIDTMNLQYFAEGRPYEIRLGDGGYRMELRPEHERIRNRVYGVGPREVRLSQDALEVLAFVAYKQPVTRPQLEAVGQANAGSLLRQLLRRELIALERGEKGRDDVHYVTTNRFLSLFGLGSLDELPQPEDVELK